MKRDHALLEAVVRVRELVEAGWDDPMRCPADPLVMLRAIELECRTITELLEAWDRCETPEEFDAFLDRKCKDPTPANNEGRKM